MRRPALRSSCLLALAFLSFPVLAQSSVSYGRITAVNLVTEQNRQAQTVGALVGGGIGLASGSGQSGSNRALRTIGGGFAGQQIGRMSSNRQAFEYTVLIGNSTTRIVTDEAGLRVGDCVAVERGSFNNLRLVDDARCGGNRSGSSAPPRPQQPSQAAQREANACDKAKEALFAANDEASFDIAERRVRLLCAD
jgi:outer membrane lipoprotein SlyB